MPIKVPFWPRTAIFNGQLNRDVNVNDDRREQEHADCPQQRPEVTKVFRITVNPTWIQENLQIAEQMSDNEKNQNNASDCDDHFLSNRRVIEAGKNIHDKFGERRDTPHASDYERHSERQGRSG
jgi:hypothetical protein